MTTAPVVDFRPHVDAIRAAVDAQLTGGSWKAYEYGQVPGADGNPGTLPNIFVLVSVERRFAPIRRQHTAQSGRSGWRVSVRSAGRTPDESRWAMAKATAALDEAYLTIDGRQTSRLQFESSTDARPDDGRYSALGEWTYTL